MLPLITRARTLGLSMVLATAGLGVAAAIPAYAAAKTWDVRVGAGNEFDTGLNRFYPSDIAIHRGDTVSFAWGGFHTITFNPGPNRSLFDFFGPHLQLFVQVSLAFSHLSECPHCIRLLLTHIRQLLSRHSGDLVFLCNQLLQLL